MKPENAISYQEIMQLGETSMAVQKLLNFLTDHFIDEALDPEKRLLLEVVSRELIRTIAGSTAKFNDEEVEEKACFEVTQVMLNYNKLADIAIADLAMLTVN